MTSTLITDVERTPNYLDEKHAIVGMNFEDIANKVTDEGLKTLKWLAFQFKSKYGSLIPKEYDPASFYVRSQYENIPIVSAYAFMVALYPETADGISLSRGYRNMNTSNIPVTHDEIVNVRQRLNVEDPYPQKKEV